MVIYTAIVGRNVELVTPLPACRYVCFTDMPISSAIWEVKPLQSRHRNSTRTARWHKCMSHVLFPDDEYTIWVDSSIVPLEAALSLCQDDLRCFPHRDRTCIYEEADVCSRLNLDNRYTMKKQMAKYKESGYPINAGLHETAVLIRSQAAATFNEAWWHEIEEYSLRDQLSFDYVRSKISLAFSDLPGNVAKNDFFLYKKDIATQSRKRIRWFL